MTSLIPDNSTIEEQDYFFDKVWHIETTVGRAGNKRFIHYKLAESFGYVTTNEENKEILHSLYNSFQATLNDMSLDYISKETSDKELIMFLPVEYMPTARLLLWVHFYVLSIVFNHHFHGM